MKAPLRIRPYWPNGNTYMAEPLFSVIDTTGKKVAGPFDTHDAAQAYIDRKATVTDKKFTIDIALGNVAISDQSAVANALERIAERIEFDGQTAGLVYDENGNRVGSWAFYEDAT